MRIVTAAARWMFKFCACQWWCPLKLVEAPRHYTIIRPGKPFCRTHQTSLGLAGRVLGCGISPLQQAARAPPLAITPANCVLSISTRIVAQQATASIPLQSFDNRSSSSRDQARLLFDLSPLPAREASLWHSSNGMKGWTHETSCICRQIDPCNHGSVEI